jgi:hypothetical protein
LDQTIEIPQLPKGILASSEVRRLADEDCLPGHGVHTAMPTVHVDISKTDQEDVYWDIQVLNTNNYITEDGTIHHNSGKTESLIYRTLRMITEIPGARIGIYEPTVDLLKRIIYPRFDEIFGNSGIKYKLNKSDGIMEVTLPGKPPAELVFRSMDNFSRIIGYETHHAICDEIDTLPADKAMEVWLRVLARNRKHYIDQRTGQTGRNSVGVTTTPEGFGFTYKLWGKEHRHDPEYELIRAKSEDNYHLPPDYIETLRKSYPPQLIDAYLNGEWVNLNGSVVYTGFDRFKSHTKLTIDDFPQAQVINIGMDFNVGRMSAAIVMKEPEGRNAYVVDEIHHVADTPAMIEAIRAKYEGRTIVVFPDASGRSRKSVDASKSDIRLLREAGFRINAPKKNPPVRQRVLSLNTMFLNGEGERHLFVNTDKCPHMTEQLEKQVYDDNGVPVKDGDEDILDALGYCVDRLFGLAKPMATVKRMRFG